MAELERQRVATAQAAPPLAGSSPAASAFSMRRRSTAGRPVVTRSMLVRAQPSQLLRPGLLAGQDAGLSHRRRGFESRSGLPSCSRTRLAMRLGCLPGEAGSIPVESALLAVAQWTSTTLLPWPRGFDSSRRDCVARLVASPRAVNPWSRVRFPGDAPRRRAGWAGTALIRRTCVVRFHGRRLPLAVGKQAIPPVSGTGDRWFDSSRPDLRGRGVAVLASLMSSRPWVRIPPALLPCGR
jgi:hypothetical protein